MQNLTDKPWLTFMVCGYKQEKFIREAVEAAFAQTYSPLQIILSDDCSNDRTFDIMRELAGSYRGPHQVVLNRNAANLGIAGHFNRMVQLACGQLLIGAAGDDVSFPNRVATIYEAWEKSGRQAVGIQSGYITINEKGTVLGEPEACPLVETSNFKELKPSLESYVRTLKPGILGAAFAFNVSTFSTFGPLSRALIHEDSVIGLRALCLGSFLFINAPLIKRRIHNDNLYSRHHDDLAATREAVIRQETRMIRDAENRVVMYDAFLSDLQIAKNKRLVSGEELKAIEMACIWRRRLFFYQAEYPNATMTRKIRILFAAWRDRAESQVINWMIARLMPRAGFRSLKVAGNSVRAALKRWLQSDPKMAGK